MTKRYLKNRYFLIIWHLGTWNRPQAFICLACAHKKVSQLAFFAFPTTFRYECSAYASAMKTAIPFRYSCWEFPARYCHRRSRDTACFALGSGMRFSGSCGCNGIARCCPSTFPLWMLPNAQTTRSWRPQMILYLYDTTSERPPPSRTSTPSLRNGSIIICIGR